MQTDPTPFELTALTKPGYEVWASEEFTKTRLYRLPHLLIVLYVDGEEPLKIIDPQNNNEEIFSAADYLEIFDYLSEEEYTRVNGRMEIDPDEEN